MMRSKDFQAAVARQGRRNLPLIGVDEQPEQSGFAISASLAPGPSLEHEIRFRLVRMNLGGASRRGRRGTTGHKRETVQRRSPTRMTRRGYPGQTR
jgi:hypothetical protein